MQFLIDSTQETPASLRFLARTLCELADTYGPSLEDFIDKTPPASINGPSSPIILHAHGPAAPIDRVPVDPATLDPAAVFGVPTGTNVTPLFPSAPAAPNATQHAPDTSFAAFAASVPQAPTMTQTSASGATTMTGTTAPLAPNPPLAAVAPSAAASDVGNATRTAQAPSTGSVTTAAVVSADRDSDGLPWDARVHSETHKKNADDTWRYRRNLDAAVKAAVVAELRAAFPKLVNTGQMSLAPPAPTAPPAPMAPPAPTAPVAPQPPVPVSNGLPLGLPNAPQPPAVLGFRDFMSAINKAVEAGRMTNDQLNLACKAVNVDGITALASEPGKIGLVHSQIAHLLGAAA